MPSEQQNKQTKIQAYYTQNRTPCQEINTHTRAHNTRTRTRARINETDSEKKQT